MKSSPAHPAYTRVVGQECCKDGSGSILVTAVIEDLNILEVVRADRIVTQLLITLSDQYPRLGFCVSGTLFEGLRLAGHECRPILNENCNGRFKVRRPGADCLANRSRQAGRVQGEGLLGGSRMAVRTRISG